MQFAWRPMAKGPRESPVSSGTCCYRLVSRTARDALLRALGRQRAAKYLQSKHAIVIRRCLGYRLEHVPVLDDLAPGIKSENVDSSPVTVAWPPLITV